MSSEGALALSPGDTPGDSAAPVVEVKGLVRRFGGVTAVDQVDLTVHEGERVAVIGPNGAGKTTLFRLIAGEMRPTEGSVALFGRDVTRMPAHKRARMGVSRTFQVSNLFLDLPVIDNVRVAAQAAVSARHRFWWPQSETDDVTRRSEEVLEMVGLVERRDHRVADLSHGEQRQLEIAMALVTQPSFLLLDEPAAGLALGERVMLRELLESLPRSLPYLLIEHDMSLALELADRVLCLNNGREVAFGTPDEVRSSQAVQDVYLGRGARDA
ncbi:MAG TPA: ABC transporter ATP-binding protein [Acidimicrobiia bacterium]|jgi:branched-chain amino acid transport system ATP-binding protein|nr:ABC transporter ATP-binding protein [Acidimicrobiia bacterium]